jgi:hypothetical protein
VELSLFDLRNVCDDPRFRAMRFSEAAGDALTRDRHAEQLAKWDARSNSSCTSLRAMARPISGEALTSGTLCAANASTQFDAGDALLLLFFVQTK